MRITPTVLALILIAQSALAQTAAPVQSVTSTPQAVPAVEQPITQNQQVMGALSSAMNGKNMQQNLGQVMVIGTLMGCVKKQVGAEATNAFYAKMQTAGKSIGQLCKTDHPVQAKELALKTIDENANDPVAKTTLGCYDANAQQMASMGGQKMAGDMARYSRWLRDPATAHREITPADICRNQK